MLLSALTLAALLQAAPLVVIPEGVPVVVQRVDQPFRKHPRVLMGEEASARLFAPSQRRITKRAPPVKRDFAFNPQTTDCHASALQRAGHPDAPQVQPLSKMPKAHAERAVVRLVGGCPVAVLIAQQTPAP